MNFRTCAKGTGAAPVGAGNEQSGREYIESQRWDEDMEGFRVIAPESP